MRKAFTLIELLVVIFIISLLMALIMPAVQSARESARTIRCTNNQKNLATALIHYENARGSLPGWREFITVVPPQTGGLTGPPGWQSGDEIAAQASWVFSILPFIEETSLFDRLRAGQVEVSPTDPSMQIPSLALLHCPSHWESSGSRAMNYVVNAGAVDDFSDTDPWVTTDGNVANGPFLDRAKIVVERLVPGQFMPSQCPCNTQCRYNRNVGRYRNAVARISDISSMDGTSHTMLTSENAQRGFWISEEIVHFVTNRAGAPPMSPTGDPLFVTAGDWRRLPDPDNRWFVDLHFGGVSGHTIEGSVGFCWPRFYFNPGSYFPCQIAYPRGEPGFAVPGNAKQGFSHPPNDPGDTIFNFVGGVYVDFDRGVYDTARIPVWLNAFTRKTFGPSWYQSARPSSHHPAIVIVSFADGSVRRINDSIDERVFVQLMTAGSAQSDAGASIPNTPTVWRNFLEGRLFNPPFN